MIMRGASIITAILCATSLSANAYDYERVIVRPDKRIEDSTGKIIAEPNIKDPQNTQYELFYRDPSKPCDDSACPSDFSIIYHPELGYVKKPPKLTPAPEDLNPNPATDISGNNSSKSGVNTNDSYKDPYHSEPTMKPRY